MDPLNYRQDGKSMKLPIEGLVSRVLSSSPIFTVDIGDQRYTLMAESSVRALNGQGAEWNADDPASIAEELTGVMDGGVVTTASTRPGGTLVIGFDSGASVSFMSDPDYESWWIVGSDGFRVVCTPGGKLTVWDPQ
ncbi:DUF6188 family protein [Nocardia sp. NPDC058705]|uniref:DUF6188 family protein n=1 Tax=Nocardia sp. NPDC058705 TaxID=3346609 RepID=UPI0036A6E5A1